jgi:hypothetical protein
MVKFGYYLATGTGCDLKIDEALPYFRRAAG